MMESLMDKDYESDNIHSEMNKEIYRLRVQIEDLEEIIGENRAKISILDEESTQITNNIEDLYMQKLELEEQNNALKEENEKIKREESKYKESIASLQVIEKDLQVVIEDSSNQIKLLEEKLVSLNKENRKLESQLLVNRDNIERLQAQGMGLKGILEIERIKNSNIEKQIEAIENILENVR